ncbi:MAG TPA: methylenetetrahydrofolate reductase [Solirubrobacteraceae bacterium]|jgi:methylenetetrahydrofolate reductase (NADPH)
MSASVSFEVFPARTPEGESQLWSTLQDLATLGPEFVSVTCGAGGSDTGATAETLRAIRAGTSLRPAGHLTCARRSRVEVDQAIAHYWEAGVRHVVALRGDVPGGNNQPLSRPDGYTGSIELIEAVRRQAPFEVTVAAYPEPHPDSRSVALDLDVLARKQAAGASRAITQFCFATEAIVRLRDRVDHAGLELPIVPGIMLATNFSAVARMAARCGASIPQSLAEQFAGLDEDVESRRLMAAIVATRQIEELRREGFEAFHFYTLNKVDVIPALCRLLELQPATAERLAA